jgi:ribosomal protein S27E
MEILKRGKVESKKDKFHEVTCWNCKTELRFNEDESKQVNDYKHGDYLEIKCPVCYKLISKFI